MTTRPRSMADAFGRDTAAAKFAAAHRDDPQPAGPHLDTLTGAPAQLRSIMADHDQQMRALRQQATSNSDTERQRITGLAKPVQARTAQRVNDLAGRVDTAHTTLRTNAERALPKPAGGVEGILGRQAHWQRAKTMLDSGIHPQDVINEAHDPELLHSLAEELPAYLRSKGATTDTAQDTTSAVYDRLAELTGGTAADARLAAHVADVHRAGIGPLIRDAQHRATVGPFDQKPSGFTAALQAQTARDTVATGGLPHPEDVAQPETEPGELGGRINAAMQRAARPSYGDPTDNPTDRMHSAG